MTKEEIVFNCVSELSDKVAELSAIITKPDAPDVSLTDHPLHKQINEFKEYYRNVYCSGWFKEQISKEGE